jgi:Ser/Thr protein kinase RdoA (MazF antagonist)
MMRIWIGTQIDRLRVNTLSAGTREGRRVVIKRRTPLGDLLVCAANVFFRLVRNPVRVHWRLNRWREAELVNFELLHGTDWLAGVDDCRTTWAEVFPGTDLVTLLAQGELDATPLRAAARELRRAHGLRDPRTGAPWSHGDPHLGNFLFDPVEDRARLIDFEVSHLDGMPAVARHGNDLLVFLQDLCGRVERKMWLPLATEFLEAYGDEEAIASLDRELLPPEGIARVWWAVRTSYLPAREREMRLLQLRRWIADRFRSGSDAAIGFAPAEEMPTSG